MKMGWQRDCLITVYILLIKLCGFRFMTKILKQSEFSSENFPLSLAI